MKITDRFIYKTECGTYHNCRFRTDRYADNGNRALWIEDENGELVIVCSVNGQRVNPDDEIGVKNWSENVGMIEFLEELGIIGEFSDSESSGYCIINYFKLTESGKELFN